MRIGVISRLYSSRKAKPSGSFPASRSAVRAGPSTPLQQGICGPKTPAICPQEATCAPPGQLLGGTRYVCQFCEGSGLIIEQLIPSGSTPQGYPSNACTRR